MMAELKDKAVRMVYQQKVVRLKIDIPYSSFNGKRIDEEDALKFLDQRVGDSIGIRISTLDGDVQKGLDETEPSEIDVPSGD